MKVGVWGDYINYKWNSRRMKYLMKMRDSKTGPTAFFSKQYADLINADWLVKTLLSLLSLSGVFGATQIKQHK